MCLEQLLGVAVAKAFNRKGHKVRKEKLKSLRTSAESADE